MESGLGEKKELWSLVLQWIDQFRAAGTVSLCLGVYSARQSLCRAESDLEVSWVVPTLLNSSPTTLILGKIEAWPQERALTLP